MDNCEPFLTPQIKAEIIQHMIDDAPNEACGVIYADADDYHYEKRQNIHSNPEKSFEMSKDDTLEVSSDDNIIAYVHSHPIGPIFPSKKDMKAQIAINKPSVIAARNPATGVAGVFSFGDHMLDYELIGRPWHYGVFDCLEATRSWHHQNTGIYIPRAPRTDWWWDGARQDEVDEEDRNIYERSIEPYGFRAYDPVMSDPTHEFHPQVGDVVFMQIASPVLNHTGVYVGNNLIYHHRFGKPSGNTPIGYLSQANYIRKWTRHRSLFNE